MQSQDDALGWGNLVVDPASLLVVCSSLPLSMRGRRGDRNKCHRPPSRGTDGLTFVQSPAPGARCQLPVVGCGLRESPLASRQLRVVRCELRDYGRLRESSSCELKVVR